MIHTCDYQFETNEEYKNIFSKYLFELSNFQKHAIKNIRDGKHVLITAHTGSGKTLPAEYAIEHFHGKKKKIVYTAPIKALSNQKFHEFTKLYPHISFGLLTGDIKTNPEADVLIMTTEILRNTLFQKKLIQKQDTNISLNFDMDIDNELACVIFDEIHYINDIHRGKVWEETIMMLPNHVQMLMLSATLDKEENFAKWIANIKEKEVIITSTNERVVPLKHYSFVTCPSSTFENITNKAIVKKYIDIISKPIILKSNNNEFDDNAYHSANSLINYLKNNKIYVKKSFVLNEVVNHLKKNNMLPAISFIFSRKGVEQSANEITTSFFHKDDTTPSIIYNECQAILRKLPNYKEYINLPEYRDLIKILKKGIAIHHSGIIPIFREMVEILFSKGYIKLLFATETFAVGINMPTKTVIFTSLNKFDGSYNRELLSHEYTQMAGRAGRRGLDTVGHVIHLNNIFPIPTITDYKFMLCGKPQTLVSKFKIHYNLILNLINSKNISKQEISKLELDQIVANKLNSFVDKSMIQNEIMKEYNHTKEQYEQAKNNLEKYKTLIDCIKTPITIITKYIDLKSKFTTSKNKQRKKYLIEMQSIKDCNKELEKDIETYNTYHNQIHAVEKFDKLLINIQNYTYETINMLMSILSENNFIESDEYSIYLTNAGLNATQVQEFHSLVSSEIIAKTDYFKDYSVNELCGLFSCFSNIKVGDEDKYHYTSLKDTNLKNLIYQLDCLYNKYLDIETNYQLDTGCEYQLSFDIINYVIQWCDAENETQCKVVLQKLAQKNIFLGEFVKALLKINNIANELEKIAELNNKIDLLQKLREIPCKTLKFVATNQSLYV